MQVTLMLTIWFIETFYKHNGQKLSIHVRSFRWTLGFKRREVSDGLHRRLYCRVEMFYRQKQSKNSSLICLTKVHLVLYWRYGNLCSMQHLKSDHQHDIADWTEPNSDIHQSIVNTLKQRAIEVSFFQAEVGDPSFHSSWLYHYL